MMHTILLATALAGTALAHEHGPIARRKTFEIKPEVQDDLPEGCSKAHEAYKSAVPPMPTAFEEASESFYKTASRTATETYEDCEWITNMPDAAATEFTEWQDDVLEWSKDDKNRKVIKDQFEECKDFEKEFLSSEDAMLCGKEWMEFGNQAQDETGWEPNYEGAPDIFDGSDKPDDDESAAPGVQTYAPAALLAAFIGSVALL